jgi:hypothetical protein
MNKSTGILITIIVLAIGAYLLSTKNYYIVDQSAPTYTEVSETISEENTNRLNFQCDAGKKFSLEYFQVSNSPGPGEIYIPNTTTGLDLKFSDGSMEHVSFSKVSNGGRVSQYLNQDSTILFETDSDKAFIKQNGNITYSNCVVVDKDQNTNSEKQIGFVKKIYQNNGNYYLEIDYIQWISDEKTCEDKRGKDSFNNGYCIFNTNALLRTFEIDPKTSIKTTERIDATGQFDMGSGMSTEGFPTTLELLFKAFNHPTNGGESDSDYGYKIHDLFNIKIDSSGKIIEISEQYTP